MNESFSKNVKLYKVQKIENNNFVTKIILPVDYWEFNLSLKNLGMISSVDEMKSINQNFNLYDFKPSNGNNNEEIPFFLLPRKDWNINQGDFIIKEKKEIKKKIFTKNDVQSIKKGFWFILLAFFISYYLISLIANLHF